MLEGQTPVHMIQKVLNSRPAYSPLLYKHLLKAEVATDQGICATAKIVTVALNEILLLVGVDRDVAAGIGDARQHEACVLLCVVQERLLTLVDRARLNLPSARGAGPRTARVRQVKATFFSRVQDVHIVLHGHCLLRPFLINQSDLVSGHASDAPHVRRFQAEGLRHRHRRGTHLGAAAAARQGGDGHNGAQSGG